MKGQVIQNFLPATTLALLNNKVDKVSGKQLSTEDFTTEEKNKLAGIEAGAEVNNISDVNATDLTDSGDSTLHYHSADRNRANHTGTQSADTITNGITNKVYTAIEQTKLSGIATGAEVNIQSNWTETNASSDAYILNKPTLGTASSKNTGISSGTIPILDSNGKLDSNILPAIAITNTFVVANEAAMLALTVEIGDIAVRTDLNKSFILKTAGGGTLANWQELLTPTDLVSSVAGKTGVVTLIASDVGLGNVTNESKATMFTSPTFTGTVSLPSTTSIGNVSETELGYIDGVTSAIQTQLNNRANKSTIVNATLLATSWTGSTAPYSYSLTVSGVTSTSVQEILPTTDITASQVSAMQAATISDAGQSANTILLKAWGTKPTIDLPIRVLLRGDI